MKGKNFKADFDNPAMQFITPPAPDQSDNLLAEDPQEPTSTSSSPTTSPAPEPSPSSTTDPQTLEEYNTNPKRPVIRYVYSEPKRHRTQILTTESTFARLKKAADSRSLSINEYINQAIIEKLEREESEK